MDALASICPLMAEAISTGSSPDLKVLVKRPVTFFSRAFSNLSIKPKRVPYLLAKYKFIGALLEMGPKVSRTAKLSA
jgi:hypothetical protein